MFLTAPVSPRTAIAALLAVCPFVVPAIAQAAVTTLVPVSYTTTSGTASNQPVSSSLALLDSTGTGNTWKKYVEFKPSGSTPYAGFRTYQLPSTIAAGTITGLQVNVNYQGPNAQTQTWTWRLYDWSTGAYVTVGSNAAAPSWGAWALLQFNATGSLASYVNPANGQIRVQVVANNAADAADIDYEALVVTTGTGSSVIVAPTPAAPPAGTATAPAPTTTTAPPSTPTVPKTTTSAPPATTTAPPTPAPTTPTPTPTPTVPKTTTPAPTTATPPPVSAPVVPTSPAAPAPAASTASIPGNPRYVSTAGNDSNPGTLAAPWRTIQRAASMAVPGDTVFVRAGVYNETVNITKSGSASAGKIAFQNFPGEVAVVDGTGLPVSSQNGLFNLTDVSYVTISGLEIRNYKSTVSSQVPVGIYLSGAGGYIDLLNNRIHDIVTTVNSSAGNALGLAVYGTKAPASINNLTISGNEIYNLKTGSSESMVVNGNVQSWRIINNVVHDNNNIGIDAIGFEGTSPDPLYDQARDGLISGNTVYNISSYGNPAYGNQYAADGIYVDGGTRIVIENNVVHHADIGVELASEHKGKNTDYITLRNNLIHSSYTPGISIGGYQAGLGTTDHCDIVNNTLYNNDTKASGSGEFQVQFNATNNSFANNIVYASNQALFVNSFSAPTLNTVALTNNLYYSPVAAASSQWVWGGKTYSGASAFQTASAQDKLSRYLDPQFVGAAAANFKVYVSSPAVNAGVALPPAIVGNYDLGWAPRTQGAGVDIGAYEQ